MRSRESYKILCDDETCEMLSELADTAVGVSYLDVVVTTKGETVYIKAPEEFLEQVRLLQTVNLYML